MTESKKSNRYDASDQKEASAQQATADLKGQMDAWGRDGVVAELNRAADQKAAASKPAKQAQVKTSEPVATERYPVDPVSGMWVEVSDTKHGFRFRLASETEVSPWGDFKCVLMLNGYVAMTENRADLKDAYRPLSAVEAIPYLDVAVCNPIKRSRRTPWRAKGKASNPAA